VNPFESRAFDDHEHVSFFRDRATGLRVIVAVHSTAPIGLAGGGCRWWTYPNADAALTDALRLSRAMSFKLALPGLPAGGAKAVILGGGEHPKSEANLHALGRAVHRLAGRFMAAEDVGTTPDDLDVVRSITPFVAQRAPGHDTADATAAGVLTAIRTGLAAKARGVRGSRVLVQGAGRVGYRLLELLRSDGAVIYVNDLSGTVVERAQRELRATPVSEEEMLDVDVDVFAPCALGDVLDLAAVPRLGCQLVAGSANNPLVDETVAEALARRGILYCPDFIASAGGVIGAARAGASELGSIASFMPSLARIAELAREVFQRAEREGRSTVAVAVDLAHAALARMRGESGTERRSSVTGAHAGDGGSSFETSSR